MISIISRIQYPDLYERMKESASKTAVGNVEFLSENDADGQPKIAETYNRLGAVAKHDILVFCHDDIVFLENGWDARIVEFFTEHRFDIGGVVGVDKYDGGLLVSAGHPHCFGKFVNRAGSELKINFYGPHRPGKELVAVDGMFLAMRKEFFDREKFDQRFNGLFFYDVDMCLRGRVGLLDILVAHYKPADRFGKYPDDMIPMWAYEPILYQKHGITPSGITGDTRSLCASIDDYRNCGHDKLWGMFENKYLKVKETA